ncbi:MAG: MMPL family transporter [Defluviicoccus sp.]|nr:MMPL family transporter [Defluviicoccus sp.]
MNESTDPDGGKAGAFFALWGRTAHRFAWAIAILAIVSAVAAGIYAARTVKINSDTADMLSAELDFRRLNIELRKTFPRQARDLAVVIDAETPERAERAAAYMKEEIARRPDLFRSAFHPQGEPFFRRNGLLLLPLADLEETADRILAAQPFLGTVWQDRSIRGLADMLSLAVERRLEEGEGSGLKGLADAMDRIGAVVLAEAGKAPGALSWMSLMFGPGDDRRSGRRQVLLVEIALAFDRFRPGKQAIGAVREIAAAMPAGLREGVSVRLTGRPALRHDELQSVRAGMELAGALSFTLVVLLLLLCFRSIRLSIAALLTLVIGLVWTAAFAAATVRVLNLISVAFAVLFIGLCVDFGIHYGLRWCEAARRGLDRGAANALAASSVGPGLALAALAAGIGFLAFLPTDFLGLAELGFIAGAGMAIGFFATMTLLPAFIAVLDARPDGPGGGGRGFSETVAHLIEGRARSVVVAAGAVLVAAAAVSPLVRFDFDPLRLKDPESESVRTVMELAANGDGDAYALVHLAASLEAADAAAARLRTVPEVESARTLSSFVPKDQDDKLDIVEEVAELVGPAFAADRAPPPTEAETVEALQGLKEKLDALAASGRGEEARAAGRLADALARPIDADPSPERLAGLSDRLLRNLPVAVGRLREALSAERVDFGAIPAALRDRWVAADGRAKVEIHARAPIHEDRDALRRFVETVRSEVPQAAGPPITVLEAGNTVVAAFLQATATAILAIALLLAVTLRSLRSVVIGFLPLVLAASIAMAAMVATGLSFNHANVIVLPLLFGLGVANGIHLLARERREGAASPAIRSSTPRAVLFSALTTAASFASLGISHHPGTASMGVLLTVALVSLLACSLTVLPGLMLTWPIRDS